MRAHTDSMRLRQANRLTEHRRVAAMKTRGDVRRRDRFHQGGFVADLVRAKRLAHVGVDVDARADYRAGCAGVGGGLSSDGGFLSSSLTGFGVSGSMMMRHTPLQSGENTLSVALPTCW